MRTRLTECWQDVIEALLMEGATGTVNALGRDGDDKTIR